MTETIQLNDGGCENCTSVIADGHGNRWRA